MVRPSGFCTMLRDWKIIIVFINTSDSFDIPIGGDRVTWVCINLCLWPVKMLIHGRDTRPCTCSYKTVSSFIGREQRLKQLCHITRYARRAQHSLIRSCLPEGGGGLYHFIAGGVVCWKKSFNNLTKYIYFTFWPKSDDVFDQKSIYEWESKCVESVFN